MLRFKQFWKVGQLLITDWACSKGGSMVPTEADRLEMCACIDKYCGDTPVTAISYLEVV